MSGEKKLNIWFEHFIYVHRNFISSLYSVSKRVWDTPFDTIQQPHVHLVQSKILIYMVAFMSRLW
jgi:hypothetical protein